MTNFCSHVVQIYLISSINHHISILNLRVPLEYIEFFTMRLEHSEVSDPTFPDWYSLQVQRSKWYDMFIADDRVQVMRAIWAVMGYLMRDEEMPDKDIPMTDA